MDFESLENHSIFQKSFYTDYLHLQFPFFRYLLLLNTTMDFTQLFISMGSELVDIATGFLFTLKA